MKVRYTHFNIVIDIDEKIRCLKILKFILQPFIENSIIHGFSNIDYLGEIKLNFIKNGSMLHISIADNGAGKPDEIRSRMVQKNEEESSNFSNIGIHNVNKRIQLHYGDIYGLEIRANEPRGVLIRINLPIIE
jgi:two-component system sensor histidine kinase YesM